MIYPKSDLYPSTNIYPGESSISGLITNRTLSDVEHAKAVLSRLANGTATQAEKQLYQDGDLIGLYNYKDINRVSNAMIRAKDVLASLGIQVAYPYTIKTDWTVSGVFDSTKASEYLSNITTLRNVLAGIMTVPEAPSTMQGLNYITANLIETIIEYSFSIEIGSIGEVQYSGDYYLGGN